MIIGLLVFFNRFKECYIFLEVIVELFGEFMCRIMVLIFLFLWSLLMILMYLVFFVEFGVLDLFKMVFFV